jgi:DNA-binding HxlR family transcriptional regulator
MLIVAALHERRMRRTYLQRHIPGISQRMLSLTLRHLERDGLVTGTGHAEVPTRAEYELPQTGQTLIAPAVTVEHNPDIEQSQQACDSRNY